MGFLNLLELGRDLFEDLYISCNLGLCVYCQIDNLISMISLCYIVRGLL